MLSAFRRPGLAKFGIAPGLGPGDRGFESRSPDHIGTQVLIRYLRSFSFWHKLLAIRLFDTFASEIRFIVSKMVTQKSKLSDTNLLSFAPKQIRMTLILKISVIVNRKVSS